MLPGVLGHRHGALQLFASFGISAQLQKQISPDTMQQMIAGQNRLSPQNIQRIEPRTGSLSHSHRYRAIQRHYRRRAHLKQGVIKKHDPLPVGLRRRVGPRVTSGNRGLQGVSAGAATQPLRATERRHSSFDL